MNRDEALQALQNEVQRLKGQPYEKLAPIITAPATRDYVAASGRRYQVEVSAAWDDKKTKVLRLFFSVDDCGLRAFFPLTKSGLVKPGSAFTGEVE